jgi:arsenical pump membrane protein
MTPESIPGEAVLAIGAYAIAIGLLFLGPRYLLLGRRRGGLRARPPWFLSSVVYAPIVGVGFLFALPSLGAGWNGHGLGPLITGADVGRVVGSTYQLVVLILAFAFASISLDRSRFFEWSAFRIASRAGGDGGRLLTLMFLLCSGLTFVTSNDIVVVAMTPIILEVGRQAGLRNLVPLLISQFVAANTLSMGLYIGTPTNIVLGDAAGATFGEFFLWMAIPALVAGAISLGMVWLVFVRWPFRGHAMEARYQVPPEPEDGHVGEAMWTKVAVVAGGLVLLSLSGRLGWPIWMVCLVTAGAMGTVDLALLLRGSERPATFLRSVHRRMPWAIAPFVFAFFLITDVLTRSGILETLARLSVSAGDSLIWTTVKFSGLSALSVNLMNDIPSSVFWTGMLPYLREAYDPMHYDAVVRAIILGANPGCYLTLIGALAGLMWMNILKTRRRDRSAILPTGWDLSAYGAVIIVPVLVFSSLAIVAQVLLEH